jgi:hypothetical protein
MKNLFSSKKDIVKKTSTEFKNLFLKGNTNEIVIN